MPKHVVIKLAKYSDKEKIKSSKTKKTATYKGKPIRLAEDFSPETV